MTPAPPDAPPPGAVCGDGVASVDDRYDCAAGGRLSLGRPGAAPARRRVRAWRAPRPGLAVWSAWAARLAASCRAPVAGGPRDRPHGCPRGGRARVVVVARPVVRHTRPTPRAADCRPAASGTPVSRSSACACAPCGDPQTSGGSLTLRWLLTLGWLQTLRWSLALDGHLHWDGSLHCDDGFHLEGGLDRESGVSAGRVCPVCRGGGPPAAACRPGWSRLPSPVRLARLVTSIGMVRPIIVVSVAFVRGESVPSSRRGSLTSGSSVPWAQPIQGGLVQFSARYASPADGGRPCVAGGGVVSCAPAPARLAARPGPPLHRRVTAAPIVPYNCPYEA